MPITLYPELTLLYSLFLCSISLLNIYLLTEGIYIPVLILTPVTIQDVMLRLGFPPMNVVAFLRVLFFMFVSVCLLVYMVFLATEYVEYVCSE